MINWIMNNKEWIFSGVGIAILSAAFAGWKKKRSQKGDGTIQVSGDKNIVGDGNVVQIYAAAPVKKSRIKIVDITVNDEREFIVDIKLRNTGDEVAFLKKISFDIMDYYDLENPQVTEFQMIGPSAEYDVILDDRPRQEFSISQSIGPNEVDRFELKMASSTAEARMATIYYLSLSIIYDEDDKTEKSGNYVWAVMSNQRWAGCYINHMNMDIARKNYLKLVEFNQYDGIKSANFNGILNSYETNKADFY
ncbi:hypothetical protein [Anaerolentibacter hominis]|uniref:hypothetical protein n=1 Tax=Anaerolentibacter hominis TaxID=3079009 RepID=UPI0031B8946F